MIGFYNYTVILTYMGVASAIFGITLINNQHVGIIFAIFCLMFSGFCDMFDGKVARTMKNRTKQMKDFGIQLDSLADVICFGVLPALINYKLSVIPVLEMSGMTWQRFLAFITSTFYVICSIIRLAYFNVMEEERQKTTTEVRKYYQGLPVTSIAIILPTVYLLKNLILGNEEPCGLLFNITLTIVAILFITDFNVKKPNTRDLIIIAVIGFIILMSIFYVYSPAKPY